MDSYLVYGNPIAQSKSPFIHQMFAQQCQQNIEYDKRCSTENEFTDEVHRFIANGGKGANVTAPFKEQAMQLSDELSVRAKAAGAVNTLSFSNNIIFGDNTDGVGLVNDLIDNNITLTGKSILLMGAGGAARGVIQPLLEQNPQQLIIVNRTLEKAKQLISHFNDERLSAISFEQTANINVDVIINATSASLSAKLPPLSVNAISPSTVCYDMVYGKELTPFLVWCADNNASKVIDGLGMLVGQAAESFYQWRGVRPDPKPVLLALREMLDKS